MVDDFPEARLKRAESALLADLEQLQAVLPADPEAVSEAFERSARVLALLARTLDVMGRQQQRQEQKKTASGDPQERQALIADIEQKLARLAQADAAPQAAAGAD